MVDELMLRDVKNILDKIRVIKSRDDYEELLIKFGVSVNSTEEQINEAIVSNMMSDVEFTLYKKYSLYKKRMDVISFVGAVEAIGEITSSVTKFYESRSKNNQTINAIKEFIAKVDTCLGNIPKIRVGTEYGKVKGNYKRYYDAFIKSGMDRYTFVEKIERIQQSSSLIKHFSKRKLKKLQLELDNFNVDTKKRVEELHLSYISERDSYGEYLRTLMTDIFTKNSDIYQISLLSLISLEGIDIPTKTLKNGVVVVDSKKKIDVTPEELAGIAFRYFQKKDEPEFNAEMFISSFREFILHFYIQELNRLENENEVSLVGVKSQFDKQKSMVGHLLGLRKAIDVPETSQEKDEEDTFALIYSNVKNNKLDVRIRERVRNDDAESVKNSLHAAEL